MDEQEIAFAEELLKHLRADARPVSDLITFYGYLSNELMRAMEFGNGEGRAEHIWADETAAEIIRYLVGYLRLCECLKALADRRADGTNCPAKARKSQVVT